MANLVANTHPFRWGDIVLAHNGSVTPVGRLRELVPTEEIERIGGTTDSALVLALVVRRVEQGEPLFDAVTAVVEDLKARFPRAALNLLVASPAELIAVHANAGASIPRDDFAASGLGDDLPRDHIDHYYRMSWLRDDRSVVFTSSGLATEGWTPMDQNTAARVDLRTLAVEFRMIGAPAVTAGGRAGEAA
jgi:predicted glutamine amidotransferase